MEVHRHLLEDSVQGRHHQRAETRKQPVGDRRDKSVGEPFDRRSAIVRVRKYTFTDFTPYKADSPLLPSGLLGPVRIITDAQN